MGIPLSHDINRTLKDRESMENLTKARGEIIRNGLSDGVFVFGAGMREGAQAHLSGMLAIGGGVQLMAGAVLLHVCWGIWRDLSAPPPAPLPLPSPSPPTTTVTIPPPPPAAESTPPPSIVNFLFNPIFCFVTRSGRSRPRH